MIRICTIGFVMVLLASSCTRMDSFMFNADQSISEYKLDDYEGHIEIDLGPEYDIPDHLIAPLSINVDGETIYAFYLGDTATIFQDTVIVYSHGNRDHLDLYWDRAKLLANVGGKNRYGVIIYDYRGYGLSGGEATEEHLYEDADAIVGWLESKGLTGDRLIMYGYSLGTAPSAELSAKVRTLRPQKLILESPFASTDVMVQDAGVMAIPRSYFLEGKFNVADDIAYVEQPFMWIHGVEDDFLAIETHGEVVYQHYNGKEGYTYRIDGAGHSDVPRVMGYEAYLKALADFIAN